MVAGVTPPLHSARGAFAVGYEDRVDGRALEIADEALRSSASSVFAMITRARESPSMRAHLAVVLMLVGASGCKDECSAETFPPRCEGNVLVTCPVPGVDQMVPVRISRKDCAASTCVSVDAGAVCALDPTPSPLCASDAWSACEAAQSRVSCSLGFVTRRDPCRLCSTTDAGVDCAGGPSTRCASSADCATGLSCRDAGTAAWCIKE